MPSGRHAAPGRDGVSREILDRCSRAGFEDWRRSAGDRMSWVVRFTVETILLSGINPVRSEVSGAEPTTPQLDLVRLLQRRLHLSAPLLDTHCGARFGVPFARLDRRQVSSLIDEMKVWQALPAELQRAQGQLDLLPVTDPGTATARHAARPAAEVSR